MIPKSLKTSLFLILCIYLSVAEGRRRVSVSVSGDGIGVDGIIGIVFGVLTGIAFLIGIFYCLADCGVFNICIDLFGYITCTSCKTCKTCESSVEAVDDPIPSPEVTEKSPTQSIDTPVIGAPEDETK